MTLILDLMTFKSSRGHLLVMCNIRTKFSDQSLMVIDRKPSYVEGRCDLDYWPIDLKTKGH